MANELTERNKYYNDEDMYKKSNLIISSKYKSTILENKLMAITLSQLKSAREDKEGSLVVELSPSLIKERLGYTGNSIYDSLAKTAARMTGRVIGTMDREKNYFMFVPLITKAEYKDGIFTVRFVPEMNKYLMNISANYTVLSLDTMLSFRSNYSFRLYEILKSRCFKSKRAEPMGENKYRIDVSISELKLEMGVINPEVGNVKSILLETGRSGTPDYERAVDAAKDQVFSSYSIFRRDCIDKAVAEINEHTEMHVEYVSRRNGKGRTITNISFYVDLSPKQAAELETKGELSEEEKDAVVDEVRDLITEKIKTAQARQIAEAADFDIEKVKKAYTVASMTAKVDNIVGFMIAAIRDEYEEPIGREKAAEGFAMQRKTDYDALFPFTTDED